MQPVRVGLNPLFGAIFFAVAAFNLYVFTLTHATMQVVLGLLMGVIGALYTFGTLMVVDGRSVQLKNPMGMTLKTHHVASVHDLTVDGRTLWVTTAGGARLKVRGTMARGGDWKALTEAITAAQAAAPAPRAKS